MELLRQGAEAWNEWREKQYIDECIDLNAADLHKAYLREADLGRADLGRADLRGAILCGANLWRAYLVEANLSPVDLSPADRRPLDFRRADLRWANLRQADLRWAKLSDANLSGADLREADLLYVNLRGADLTYSSLVGTNLERALLKDCRIYGISAWDPHGTPAEQANLIITPEDQPAITVDDLKVAQFIYLLLNNPEIRSVIDTITTKVVLILGRFTEERKAVLDAVRDALRGRNYIPILFDFDRPDSKDYIETAVTLARMARFVIADVTDPKVVLQELEGIKALGVPVQPILLHGAGTSVVLVDFMKFPWFLKLHLYRDQQDLLASLAENVITPAEEMANAIRQRRQEAEAEIRGLERDG